MRRRMAPGVLQCSVSSPECCLHKCVCSVKIQGAAHLGQMHQIFLGIWCTHFSRYILRLNKVFKIHGIRRMTTSASFFQTHGGFQLTRVIVHNLLRKSLMKIIQIFNLKTSVQTTVTFQGEELTTVQVSFLTKIRKGVLCFYFSSFSNDSGVTTNF